MLINYITRVASKSETFEALRYSDKKKKKKKKKMEKKKFAVNPRHYEFIIIYRLLIIKSAMPVCQLLTCTYADSEIRISTNASSKA